MDLAEILMTNGGAPANKRNWRTSLTLTCPGALTRCEPPIPTIFTCYVPFTSCFCTCSESSLDTAPTCCVPLLLRSPTFAAQQICRRLSFVASSLLLKTLTYCEPPLAASDTKNLQLLLRPLLAAGSRLLRAASSLLLLPALVLLLLTTPASLRCCGFLNFLK